MSRLITFGLFALNAAMASINVSSGSYGWATISAFCALLMLAALVVEEPET